MTSIRAPRILLACLYADFGQNGQMKPDFSNASWEYENIYKPWKQLEDQGLIELETHWVDTQSNPAGLERLISLAKDADLVFQVPVTHALGIHLPQARQIIEGGTPIVSFHPDMHLRYDHPAGDRFVKSRVVEGYDTHFVTPAKHMMDRLQLETQHSYCMPFGVPTICDRKLHEGGDEIYDVTFVGQMHGIREQVISTLRGAGIRVHTWGHFWPDHPDHHGRPSVPEMVDIFNRTKVNLNLRWCSRSPQHGQIKGRDFELLGCGRFMLASQHFECNDLHELYTPNKEFDEFTMADMVDKVRYWLENDTSRNAVAYNAYQKREENLWTSRLKKFLQDWGTW